MLQFCSGTFRRSLSHRLSKLSVFIDLCFLLCKLIVPAGCDWYIFFSLDTTNITPERARFNDSRLLQVFFFFPNDNRRCLWNFLWTVRCCLELMPAFSELVVKVTTVLSFCVRNTRVGCWDEQGRFFLIIFMNYLVLLLL